MAVPDWNRVEGVVSTTSPTEQGERYIPGASASFDTGSIVRVTTSHEGRATYHERGTTTFTVQQIIDDGLENGHWDRQVIDNGNLPNAFELRDYAREWMYESGEVDDYDTIEYTDYDQTDWEVDDIEIIN
jgi:hypothetical protein